MTDSPTIFTIGHGNAPANEIVDLLRKNEIQVLVDVRSVPYSKFAPDFNQREIKRRLNEAGLKYISAGDRLGGRPSDPTVYRQGDLPSEDAERADYPDLVDYDLVAQRQWYKDGIASLIKTAGEYRTAIMCSEENPYHCHRSMLIARTLIEHGIAVIHIRRNGELQQHYQQLSLF